MVSFNPLPRFMNVQSGRHGIAFEGRSIDMTHLKEQIRRGNREKVDEILKGADPECFRRHSEEITDALNGKSQGDDDWNQRAKKIGENVRKLYD